VAGSRKQHSMSFALKSCDLFAGSDQEEAEVTWCPDTLLACRGQHSITIYSQLVAFIVTVVQLFSSVSL